MTVCLADVFVFPILEGHVLAFVFFADRLPRQLFLDHFLLDSWVSNPRTFKKRVIIGRINFQLHKDFFIAVVKKKVSVNPQLWKK